MGKGARGAVGAVVGLIAGLLIVKLINDALVSNGHVLKGGAEAIITAVVMLVGLGVGRATGRAPSD